jgi:hypothetical protein
MMRGNGPGRRRVGRPPAAELKPQPSASYVLLAGEVGHPDCWPSSRELSGELARGRAAPRAPQWARRCPSCPRRPPQSSRANASPYPGRVPTPRSASQRSASPSARVEFIGSAVAREAPLDDLGRVDAGAGVMALKCASWSGPIQRPCWSKCWSPGCAGRGARPRGPQPGRPHTRSARLSMRVLIEQQRLLPLP